MSYLVIIIAFIIVFGVLVTVHEYGHMFFAKRAGIVCPGFTIGMGPKTFSFRKNGVFYTIRLLPASGYVRMARDGLGESPVEPGMNVKIKLSEENEVMHIILDDYHKLQQVEAIEARKCDFKDDLFIGGITVYNNERHRFRIARESFFVENGGLVQIAPRGRQFAYKKPWPKFLTLFAGLLSNLILALVLFIDLTYYQGTPISTVEQVANKHPIQQAGLQRDDKTARTGRYKIPEFNDVNKALDKVKDNKTTVKFERDGETKSAELIPKGAERELTKVSSETECVLGLQLASGHIFFKPIVYGSKSFLIGSTYIFSAVVGILVSIFTGRFPFDMLNGPVGIYHSVDSVVKVGVISSIGRTALLSVSLDIMNLIPIPALDDGRISLAIYEAVFRKPVNKKAETTIIAIGATSMIVIMISVTWDDIQRCFS